MKKSTLKQILCTILAMAILASLLIVPAGAATVLRYGSRGNDVKTLQTMLNEITDADLKVDGIFGKDTRTAVRQFQREYGLTVDGVVGRNTWAALEDALYAADEEDEPEEESLFASTSSKVITYSKRSDGKDKLTANFRVREFACQDGSDKIKIDRKLVALLQDIRDHFGAPVHINSAYRTPSHNEAVGGSSNSYHVKGRAADIWVEGVDPAEVAAYAESLGCKGIGLYSSFVHVDTRTSKFYWEGSDQIPVYSFR